MSETGARRPVRSYVLRQGRMTDAQRRALATLWPRYGVELGVAAFDLPALFGRSAPTVLEIGFGNGDALISAACRRPDWNFLGAEVHRPGMGSLLLKLEAQQLGNVRAIAADVNEVLVRLAPGALHAVHLFFPDPWPKKRHHKRRLVQRDFAARLAHALTSGGYLLAATDWEDYALQMREVFECTPGLVNAAGKGAYAARPDARPPTRFERRGQFEGRPVRDLLFRKA